MAETCRFFTTGGAAIHADLYLPAGDRAAGDTVPGIVYCLGFGSVRAQVAAWGERLADMGFAVLVPDYRGFGDSEGTPGRIVPTEQVDDLRAAVTYLASRDEVDESRLVALGVSTGGANSVYLGGVDPRITAVVSIVGWGDGERHMRALRRHHEWLDFLARVREGRVRRVLEGKDEPIDPDEILVRDPEAVRWRQEMLEKHPAMRFSTTLESAERIIEFRPESVLPYTDGTALLVVHAEDDALIPVDEALSMHGRAREPKGLVILPGVAHHGVHEGAAFEECLRLAGDWFDTHAGAV